MFKQRSTKILLGIVAVLLLAVCGTFIFILTRDKPVVLEDFTDKPISEVTSWLEENKVKSDRYAIIYEEDDKIEKDHVVRQNYPEGYKLTKDDKLKIVVSNGSPVHLIELIDMNGMDEQTIRAYMEEAGFTDWSFNYEVSDTIEKGKFIKINTEEKSVMSDTAIIITLSVGKENVGVDITMPDLTSNYSLDNIKAWAATNNIKLDIKYEYSDDKPKGTVFYQSITQGSMIKTGDNLTIKISNGKGIVLKDLTGISYEEAKKYVADSGIKATFINYHSDVTKKDYVISTTPAASTIAEGQNVNIYISLGSVIVPDLIGKKEADVITFINTENKNIYDKNNYVKYEIKIDNTSDKPEGTIIKTSPAKDEALKFKSTLTVTVAGKKSATVESKKDITVDELKTYLEGLNMKLGTKTREVYSDYAYGKVVRNDEGVMVEGTSVNYVTSLGKYQPDVSKFNGSTEDSIRTAINNANAAEAGGWVFATSESYSDSVSKGSAFNCASNSNTKTINCTISKGAEPKPITINNDDWTGKDVGSLTAFLTEKGLSGASGESYSDVYGAGTIISVTSGTYYKGDTVGYIVSKGQDPANAKIVINDAKVAILNAYPKDGMTYDTTKNYATNLLHQWGFTNIDVQGVTSDEPQGTLINHNLTSGEYKASDHITVTISTGV